MGPSPQYYIHTMVIGPLVLEKEIFEGFLPYMGHLGHMTQTRKQTFVPRSH